MKMLIMMVTVLFSLTAFAEHEATYCGKMLDGKEGTVIFTGQHPEAIIAIESRIKRGVEEPWYDGYGALLGLNANELEFVQKAVRSSKQNGTLFCVKAIWAGAAYGSLDIENISLATDKLYRIDYRSSFAKD